MTETRPYATGVHRLTALAMRRMVNPALRALLASPAHGLASSGLVGVAYTGRVSGHSCRLVTGYAPAPDGRLLVLVGHPARKTWWRNFRQPQPVELLLRGRRLEATGRVLARGTHEWGDAAETYASVRPRTAPALAEAELVVFSLS